MFKHIRTFSILLSFLVQMTGFTTALTAQSRVILDGFFSDWESVAELWSSPATTSPGNVTLRQLKTCNDERFLMIYFKSAEIFSLQNDFDLKIYLDTDNNPQTGFAVDGMGAEIQFTFGQRAGRAWLGTGVIDIGFSDFFVVTMPTIWSNQYEISFDRNAQINANQVFSGNSVGILLKDESVNSPTASTTGVRTYTFTENDLEPLPGYSLRKKAEHLRLLSHNVEFDGFFAGDRKPAFARLYHTIQPQIIGLEEIYAHSPADVTSRLEEILPSPTGETWHAAQVGDNFIATRYTIKNHFQCGPFDNGAFLVDLRPDYPTDALFIVAHPPCCAQDEARQQEIDAIAAFVREAKIPGGELTLTKNTPIILLGDMNLVGDPQQLRTLLSGDIVNEGNYGPDFTPDWDGTDFLDAIAPVTNLPMAFTQGTSTGPGSFSKGRLDFMIHSGSVLNLENAYVLYTDALPVDSLDFYGLERDDSQSASDHFPLVCDFSLNTNSEETTILMLRENDADGIPVTLNEIKTVSGIVTVADEFGPAGAAYIQDETAGIAVYGQELVSQLVPGNLITITAKVGFYHGLTELVFDATAAQILVHDTVEMPKPEIVTISDILNQQWNGTELLEGKLLQLNDVEFLSSGSFAGETNYLITDGQDTLALRVDKDTNLPGAEIPENPAIVIGILGQYKSAAPFNSGYQFFPRSTADIIRMKIDDILTLRGNDGNGSPASLNQIKSVSGVVTVAKEFGNAGPAYLQDKTAGIAIYGADFVSQLARGDSITLTGKVGFYNGLTEFVVDTASKIKVHRNTTVPAPRLTTIQEIQTQEWDRVEILEGLLIQVRDVQFSAQGTFAANTNYAVTTGWDTLDVRIDAETSLVGQPIPTGNVNLTGIIGQFDVTPPYDAGYQLLPRDLADIEPGTPLVKSLTLTQPQPGAILQANQQVVEIAWESENVETVNLAFRRQTDTEWTPIVSGIDAATGAYHEWITPEVVSDSGFVRIEDAADTTIFAVSGMFYIQGPPSAVEKQGIPGDFALYQNYPNPFNPVTQIRYQLPVGCHVTLGIYNAVGQKMEEMAFRQAAGYREIYWNAAQYASGIYVCTLTARPETGGKTFFQQMKMVLIK